MLKEKIILTSEMLEKISSALMQHTIKCYDEGARQKGNYDDCMPLYAETMNKIYRILGCVN